MMTPLRQTHVSHPVHDENLTGAEFLLELPGCDGHRVEITEPPERQTHTPTVHVSESVGSNMELDTIYHMRG